MFTNQPNWHWNKQSILLPHSCQTFVKSIDDEEQLQNTSRTDGRNMCFLEHWHWIMPQTSVTVSRGRGFHLYNQEWLLCFGSIRHDKEGVYTALNARVGILNLEMVLNGCMIYLSKLLIAVVRLLESSVKKNWAIFSFYAFLQNWSIFTEARNEP